MNVLIIGKNFSGLKNYLLEHGHGYLVLRDIKTMEDPTKRLKNQVVCDFSSRETILEAVRNLKQKPDAIMSVYENYILPMAYVGEELGLPTIPVKAAEACTDKQLMREAFAKSPKPISPDFDDAMTFEKVESFANAHEFPLILKPANLSKSLLVTKSVNMEELKKNWQRTMDQIDAVYKKYAPDRKPKIIIEEFLEGSVHSIDAFVDVDGEVHLIDGIVDYQTGYDIGYDDNFHYSRLLPSRLTGKDKEDFMECAELGCKMLGMKNSAAHIEIIMTKNGPRLVEIGARNGGYRERMYRLANGIDITGNALALAFGKAPDIQPRKHEPVAVLELFPKEPGEFIGIKNEEALRKLPSLEYLSIKHEPGEFIGKSSDGFKMTAVVILHNEDSEQFEKDLNFVNNKVYVLTKK